MGGGKRGEEKISHAKPESSSTISFFPPPRRGKERKRGETTGFLPCPSKTIPDAAEGHGAICPHGERREKKEEKRKGESTNQVKATFLKVSVRTDPPHPAA